MVVAVAGPVIMTGTSLVIMTMIMVVRVPRFVGMNMPGAVLVPVPMFIRGGARQSHGLFGTRLQRLDAERSFVPATAFDAHGRLPLGTPT